MSESPHRVKARKFTPQEHETWSALYNGLDECRRKLAVPEFSKGLKELGIDGKGVPDLGEVNKKLRAKTGWQGVPVEGLEEATSFYPMMAERFYPIGWFIRDKRDLGYTPAPDVFHDLYGHLPFFVDEEYANFCADFGRRVKKYLDEPEIVQQFERLFWFTAEFGLLSTNLGTRLFGGGILSSKGESYYALSTEPHVVPFDLNKIRAQAYRVDVFQETLFQLPSRRALFECLDDYEKLVRNPL